MSIYIECDICGTRELINKDGKSKEINRYWLTPSLLLSILPKENLDLKELKEICVCKSCDDIFEQKVKEYNEANVDWVNLLIESTKDEIKKKEN